MTSSRSGLGTLLEVMAFAVAVWIAVALMQDDRVTAMNTFALWMAVAVSVAPVARFAARRSGSLWVDILTALLLVVAILGSFTIGGLALGIPVIFLGVGGVFHHLGSRGDAFTRRSVFTAVMLGGVFLLVVGAVSMGPSMILAPAGLLLSVMGALARRSTRRPKEGQQLAG